MFKLGVTGSFGSGKTTVASMFRRRGALVVDADAIVHRLLRGHRGCRAAVGRAFGPEVLTGRGVDRLRLGRIVFADRRALRKLEKILHPLVWEETLKECRSAGKRVVVIDAPLLIETGWHSKMDAVVVVKARLSQQVARLQTRSGLSKADIMRRIRCQLPYREKIKYADFVVDNTGAKDDTDRQVRKIWDQLR